MCNQAWKKRCFGGKKEVDCFLLSLFLKLWNQNPPTLPQQISFGDPRCSLEAVSFIRKQSGEKFNPIQASKKGRSLAKRCFLCQTNEKSIDHISLNCVKTRVLSCYFLSLVYLGFFLLQLGKLWRDEVGFLWVKRGRRCGGLSLYVSFGQFGRLGIESPLKTRCCLSKI